MQVKRLSSPTRIPAGGAASPRSAATDSSHEKTTGHAFVVLQLEAERNKLLNLPRDQLLFPRAAAQVWIADGR